MMSLDTNRRYRGNDVVLVGGGGLALMLIDAINSVREYNIIGILDDYADQGTLVYGYPVLGKIEEQLPKLYEDGLRLAVNAISGMASSQDDPIFSARVLIADKIRSYGFIIPNVIHNRAFIEPTVKLGDGNIVLAGANIGSKAIIEDDCYINTNTMISHECHIGRGVKVAPGAILAGRIKVGENTLIGMGVTVYMGAKIGKNAIIFNGVDVFKSVANNKTLTGEKE